MTPQEWAEIHKDDDPHPMSAGVRAARYLNCMSWGHVGQRGRRVGETACVRCNPWLRNRA